MTTVRQLAESTERNALNLPDFYRDERAELLEAATLLLSIADADEKMPTVAWRHKTHAHGRWLITQMTPEQAAEWNSVFDSDPLVRQSDALAAVAAVTAELDALKQQRDTAEGMAGCMVVLRDDLIRLGLIKESVAPMFMTEAVVGIVAELTRERDALRDELSKNAGQLPA